MFIVCIAWESSTAETEFLVCVNKLNSINLIQICKPQNTTHLLLINFFHYQCHTCTVCTVTAVVVTTYWVQQHVHTIDNVNCVKANVCHSSAFVPVNKEMLRSDAIKCCNPIRRWKKCHMYLIRMTYVSSAISYFHFDFMWSIVIMN